MRTHVRFLFVLQGKEKDEDFAGRGGRLSIRKKTVF